MQFLSALSWCVVLMFLGWLTIFSAKKALSKFKELKSNEAASSAEENVHSPNPLTSGAENLQTILEKVEAPVAQLVKSVDELADKSAEVLKNAADKLMASQPALQKVKASRPKPKDKPKNKKKK